jgi:hypothetical protein
MSLVSENAPPTRNLGTAILLKSRPDCATLKVMDAHDQCPPVVGDLAEAYCMGSLSPSEAAAFEDHYLLCNHCAAVLQDTDRFVRAMREAACQERSAAPRVRAAGSA